MLIGGVTTAAPFALPVVGVAWLLIVAGDATLGGVVGYLHKRYFEPNGHKLVDMSRSYNRKVATLVRASSQSPRLASTVDVLNEAK